jgi:glycosyltransferase involved in cell wall biosynthesis
LSTTFLSIVIPAFNEEKRLPGTLGQVFAYLQKQSYTSEVIVVENGSTDRTFEIANELARKFSNLIVKHEDLAGKGNAVRSGMLSARGEFRFICDADLSMPIEEVAKFLPPQLSDFDIAIASREGKGAVRYNEPSYRHWGGRVINLIIRMFILPEFQDTQCGFKCFRAKTTEKLFRKQTLTGWAFDIELLYIAKRERLQVSEVPIHWYFDADTKVSAVRDALRMISDIFRIRKNASQGRYDQIP